MSASCRNSQKAWIIWTFKAFSVATILSGTGADSSMEICPLEEVELNCPPRELAIQNNEYDSLLWSVSDPDKPNNKHEYILYCGENPVSCENNSLRDTGFQNRISVRNPVGGKLYVKHLDMHIQLSYTCKVELKDDRPPLAYQVIVSSSVYCLTGRAGQDLNLCPREFGKTPPSKELIDDIWWSTIQADGKKKRFFYCNSKSCKFLNDASLVFKDRIKANRSSIILSKVGQDDRGLEFQRRIEPNTMKPGAKPVPQFYRVKIKNVLPADTNITVTSPSSTTVRNNSTTGTGQEHGTKPSAGDRVALSVTVLVSLVMAIYIT